jgi:hypothetical protein
VNVKPIKAQTIQMISIAAVKRFTDFAAASLESQTRR